MSRRRGVKAAPTEVDPRTSWPPRSSLARPGDDRAVTRVDILVIGASLWRSNKVRFLDEDEALAFARGLCERWPIIRKIRIVPQAWPEGESYRPDSEHPQWRIPA
jgi:hypothetical protein